MASIQVSNVLWINFVAMSSFIITKVCVSLFIHLAACELRPPIDSIEYHYSAFRHLSTTEKPQFCEPIRVVKSKPNKLKTSGIDSYHDYEQKLYVSYPKFQSLEKNLSGKSETR